MCGGLWTMKSRCPPRLLDNTKPPPGAAPADAQLHITSSRHYPASPAAGLAIVAALEAELVQSGSATSSCTSSLPIPISSSSSSSSSSLEEETKDHILFDPNDRGAPKPTIFSTSLSPPSSYDIINCTLYKQLSYGDFLGVCFSCNRPLGPGKDIYMYRGDQAFCSIECRHNHIVADESLHRSIHISQQCVQASSPTSNQSEVRPLIAMPILV